MFQWSIDALRRAGCSPIVLVVPPGRAPDFVAGWDDLVIAEGGATRRASVASGLDEIGSDHVLVHDAARPLVSEALVRRVIEGLGSADAVVPGLPVTETLKRAEGDLVADTVDREGLWSIQTPQGFRTSLLREAHEAAAREGVDSTDDAGLVERLGKSVHLVPGQLANIKLTYPDDFRLAQTILKGMDG